MTPLLVPQEEVTNMYSGEEEDEEEVEAEGNFQASRDAKRVRKAWSKKKEKRKTQPPRYMSKKIKIKNQMQKATSKGVEKQRV